MAKEAPSESGKGEATQPPSPPPKVPSHSEDQERLWALNLISVKAAAPTEDEGEHWALNLTSTGVAAPPEDENGPWALNLISVIVTGTLFLWWVSYFTDALPAVGGLLGLGGFLAWAALAFKLLPEERILRIQQAIDRAVIQSRKSWIVCLLVVAAGIFGASFSGTVEVDAILEPDDRAIWLGEVDDYPEFLRIETPDRLAAHSRRRFLIFCPWGSPTERLVKVSGLPSRLVRINRFRRQRLHLPNGFARLVLFVVPGKDLLEENSGSGGSSQKWTLHFTGPGWTATAPFDGRSVWVGATGDLPVPESLAARFSTAGQAHLRNWQRPHEATPFLPSLISGSRVEVTIRGPAGVNPPKVKGFTIDKVANRKDSVQTVVLEPQ